MASAAVISDLLALAVIRRILLELGHPLQPEAPGTLVGPLEIWMHQPRPELDGQSPLRALAMTDGEIRVRRFLLELISAMPAASFGTHGRPAINSAGSDVAAKHHIAGSSERLTRSRPGSEPWGVAVVGNCEGCVRRRCQQDHARISAFGFTEQL